MYHRMMQCHFFQDICISIISFVHVTDSVLFAAGADSSKSGKMGRDNIESMASFASVAAMSQITPSPDKTAETAETCLFQSSPSPKRTASDISDKNPKPAQTPKDKNIFESFVPDKIIEVSQVKEHTQIQETDTTVPKSHDQTNNSHDKESRSDNVSCDSCKQLQAASDIDQSCSSPAPRSPQSYVEKISKKLLNKSVKHLKRKLKRNKSKKSTRLKRSKYAASRISKQPEEYSKCNIEVFDGSFRSVCSESEPLPVFDHQKRSHSDSDSEIDETFTKKRKLRTLSR